MGAMGTALIAVTMNGESVKFRISHPLATRVIKKLAMASREFVEVTPLDMNIDSDGFASFARSYIGGTNLTLTAPLLSNGRKFLRWSVDGVVQPYGLRTLNVTAGGDMVLNAIFQRPGRLVPDRPAEGDGDLE